VFGVPLPLCSCSVIPVAASLRRHGAGRGATAAFLLSTPQTGVDSVFVTYGLLGPLVAVFRPLAALATGLVGGAVIAAAGNGSNREPAGEACPHCCCDHASGGRLARALHFGFVTLPRDIGKPLLVGLVVAGLIAALVPGGFFSETLGTGLPAMLLMMVVGIPIYVCATASVPIAAAMILAGLTPGAALVFLMTGPATNAAAVATVWKMLGHRSAALYLAVVAGTALACGLLLDRLFVVTGVTPGHAGHHLLPPLLEQAAAVALVVVLALALWPRKPRAA
jgi:uncharacterized membrane protein YraQ (UPF0718 family)